MAFHHERDRDDIECERERVTDREDDAENTGSSKDDACLCARVCMCVTG